MSSICDILQISFWERKRIAPSLNRSETTFLTAKAKSAYVQVIPFYWIINTSVTFTRVVTCCSFSGWSCTGRTTRATPSTASTVQSAHSECISASSRTSVRLWKAERVRRLPTRPNTSSRCVCRCIHCSESSIHFVFVLSWTCWQWNSNYTIKSDQCCSVYLCTVRLVAWL